LRQSEARLITVLDTTVEGILTVTPAGLIETANAAATGMFGRRPGQLEGLPAESIIRAADETQGPNLLSHLAQSAATPSSEKHSEFVGINRKGEIFPIDISVGKNRHGGPHYTCVLRDMTEERKTEEQLRQNQQRLKQQETELLHMQRLSTVGELAAMMAHEINQPLGAIGNYLGGISLRFETVLNDHPPLRETVEESARLANRTSHIVQSIRNLVRRREDEREWLDMAALVQETASLLKQEMDRHQIQLQNDLPDSLPLIEGERVKLQQLLLNLILNAIEALVPVERQPRVIRIQTPDSSSDDVLEIRISDNGIGLSPDRLTRIFDPFVTSKSDGIGLGLSICKSIIESHGGEIAVTESGPNGSTFSIRLPKKRQQGAA
jgi:two-component system, LuxR family, sensor kinase FixL